MVRAARLAAGFLMAACVIGACSRCASAPSKGAAECTHVAEGFGPEAEAPVRVEAVVTGLEVPWGLAFLPGDGTGDMLVTERPGRLRLVEDGSLVSEPVLTIDVRSESEEGLLGLALHPDFESNRLFYLYYTVERDGDPVNRVVRYRLAQDRRSATQDRVILDDIPAARYHSGGRIRFGPDGNLYAGTGDSREPDLSQDRDSLAGKLLRVTPEGEVPEDNPFDGSPVWTLGIRNNEGFDWRPGDEVADGPVLVDHGPSGELGRTGGDEVNVAGRGVNLGWPTIWGCETKEGMRAPSLVWESAVPPGGAEWYDGDAIPQWKGSLLVGTLGSRHLHRVVFEDDGRTVARHEVLFKGDPPGGYGRLRTVVTGPDGALYVTTSNCDGRGACPADKDRILRLTGTE
ncbi:MAG: PQQ-dependent sugar dehydrogenase [Myxococcota bacterium]